MQHGTNHPRQPPPRNIGGGRWARASRLSTLHADRLEYSPSGVRGRFQSGRRRWRRRRRRLRARARPSLGRRPPPPPPRPPPRSWWGSIASWSRGSSPPRLVATMSTARRRQAVRAVADLHTVVQLPLTVGNVESVLDKVRPHLIADGGDVALHEIDGNVVRLKLQGACGSCPSSVTTMKMGIQRRLMENIPDISAVERISDREMGLKLNEANVQKVAFLASEVGPRVAAACASAALSVLTRDNSRMCSEGINAVGHSARQNYGPSSSISPETVKHAAICGLSAAATKSKLFADHEEREIQRLAATIINHQLKRLELKLKQFAEVETMLLKESERFELMRQQLAAQRVPILSTRLPSAGGTLPGGGSTMSSNPMNQATSVRPQMMQVSMPQSSMPSMYANNMQGHPQMAALLQQRQQMLSFGPRLPLSAIHPGTPSSSSPSMMFNPGMPNPAAPNHHSLLRPSGNNSNVG